MPSSNVYTDESLALASDIISLTKQIPKSSNSPTADIWDGLLSALNGLLSPVLSNINTAISNVITNVKTAVSDAVTPIVEGVSSAVSGVINDISSGIGDTISSFTNWLKSTVANIISGIDQAIGAVQTAISNVSSWLNSTLAGLGSTIQEAIMSVIDSVSTWLAGAVSDVGDWITNAYENVKEWLAKDVEVISSWVTTAYEHIKAALTDVYNTVANIVETAKTTIEDKVQDLIVWFNNTADKISAWVRQITANLLDWFGKNILPKIEDISTAAQQVIGIFGVAWEAVSTGDYTKAFGIIDSFFKGVGVPAPIETIHAFVSALAYFWETVKLQFLPMEVKAQKDTIINLAMEPIDLSSAGQALFKGAATEADYYANAALSGISKDRARLALEGQKALPSPGQIQQSFLRGEIDIATHDKMLASFGLSPDYIELIKSLYMIIPGPSDLIRMAVKEAFTPEIADKFGQYQDYPTAFTEWATKIGLSEEWATRYWAAHWELPSVTMGFEMLHRNIISNEELTVLLRALDIMPYWRERLIQMSYNPLTRVDVRRMYQLGVIGEDQVKRSYLDLGYDEQKASWLTEFTIRYYTPEDQTQQDTFKSQARSVYSTAYKKHIISEEEYRQFLLNMKYYPDDIELLIQIDNFSIQQDDKLFDLSGYRKDWQKLVLNAYDRGLIHVNELRPMLSDMGYSDQEADLEISLSDYNRSLAIRNLITTQVREQYITFILDEPGLYNLLNQFNFTPEEIAKLQEEWNIERSLRTRKPTITDLKKFYQSKLISLPELLDELRGMGYNEKYIPMFAQILG